MKKEFIFIQNNNYFRMFTRQYRYSSTKVSKSDISHMFGLKVFCKINYNCICINCLKSTLKSRKDYYMVNNNIWRKINPNIKGMLCIKCCEKKMSRKLELEDLYYEARSINESNPYLKKLFK